jgi:autotransporter translocation and assembly factor TamB
LGVAGELNGRFVLGGSIKAPEVSADLQSARLALPGFGQLRGLTLAPASANGKSGRQLSGKLRLAGTGPAERGNRLRDVTIDADGVRSQHRLHGSSACRRKAIDANCACCWPVVLPRRLSA